MCSETYELIIALTYVCVQFTQEQNANDRNSQKVKLEYIGYIFSPLVHCYIAISIPHIN